MQKAKQSLKAEVKQQDCPQGLSAEESARKKQQNVVANKLQHAPCPS